MKEYQLSEFTEALSAKTAVPGGGGAAAYVASMGIALGTMTGNYTLGKKRYQDYEESIRRAMEQAEELRKEFLDLMEKDAEAFLPLSKAYGIPKEDPSRDTVLEEALLGAAEVPLSLMRSCIKGLALMMVFREKGSKLMQSDVSSGTYFLYSALRAATFNVYINTELMRNREKALSMDREARMLLSEGRRNFDAVMAGED